MSNATASPRPQPLVRLWNRAPILARAVLGGVFVFSVLQLGWNLLVGINLGVFPDVPWSVPAGLVYLWVVFQFFNGRWGFTSNAEARRQSMRARMLTRAEWRPAAIACTCVFVFVLSFAMLTHRLIQIPEDPDLPTMSWWTLYPTLIMVSIVAGVSEEAGFRGYMQGPLEKRYGPWLAIGIASLAFWLLHLNHPSGFARFPYLFAAGACFGALTYVARSIIPAMVTHATLDSVAYVGSTAAIGPEELWAPPLLKTTGLSPGFVVTLIVAVASGAAMVAALRGLNAERNGENNPGPVTVKA